MKFGTLVVEGNLEGTLSQSFYLCPSLFVFMKSIEFSCKH